VARSLERAERLEAALDGPVVVASAVALVAVVLELLERHGPVHTAGQILSWAVWAVFLVDAAVLLSVHPFPGRFARSHWFELAVLLVAFPLWPVVFPRLLGVEIAPTFDLLKVAKLAKVTKAVRLVRHRGESRALVIGFVAVAVAVGLFVVVTGH
jgi:hypothetical protein